MSWLNSLIVDLSRLDSSVVLAVVLLVMIIIVLDAISMYAAKKRASLGLEPMKEAIKKTDEKHSPRGGKYYISDKQLLSGSPDAVINEEGFYIPIMRKPMAKKIKDRHIAQMLVYMRLIEEFEGKKPPYGYLLLGEKCRRVKIYNSEEKQAWLQEMLDKMHKILEEGETATPKPQLGKCNSCHVKANCKDAYKEA